MISRVRSAFATLWKPAAVGLILAIMVTTGVRVIGDLRKQSHAKSDELVAAAVATRVESFIEARLSIIEHVAADLGQVQAHGARIGILEHDFRIEAEAFVERFPDTLAVNRINAAGIITEAVPLEPNREALGLDIANHPFAGEFLRQARESGRTVLSAPLELAQGGTGVVAYRPIVAQGVVTGFVNLVFRAGPLIEAALSPEICTNYRIAMVDSAATIYGERIAADANDAVSRSIGLRNRQWTLTLSPQPALTASRAGSVEGILLVAGLAVSTAIAWFIWLVTRQNATIMVSEQRFRDFSEASSDYFYELDSRLRYNYFSPRFGEVTGLEAAGFLGRTVADCERPPGVEAELWQSHLATLTGRREFRNFVNSRTRPDGTTVWLSASGKPVFDARGAFAGYRCTGRDVTREIVAIEDLRRLRAEADKANRAKSEFLANMSHDLRTPLNAIVGFSEIMQSKIFGPLDNERYEEYADHIHDCGNQLVQLVDTILELAKVESGEYTLHEEWLEIGRELDLARARNAPESDGELLERITTVGAGRECRLLADRRVVIQILDNLIGNAIKYAGDDAAITVGWSIDADGCGELFVRDDGNGIAEQHLDRLTEPFFQAGDDHDRPSTRRRISRGIGLGLNIVSHFARLHNAQFLIESELGKGSTFTVRFPAERVRMPRQPLRLVK